MKTILYENLNTKNDKHIIVGSNSFFKCYNDFKQHNSDIRNNLAQLK